MCFFPPIPRSLFLALIVCLWLSSGPASAQQFASQQLAARSFFDPLYVGDQVFELGNDNIVQQLISADEFRSMLGRSGVSPTLETAEKPRRHVPLEPVLALPRPVRVSASENAGETLVAESMNAVQLAGFQQVDQPSQPVPESGATHMTENSENAEPAVDVPPMAILAYEAPVTSPGSSILASKLLPELLELIDQHKTAIKEDQQTTENQKSLRLQPLSSAAEWIQKAIEYQNRIIQYENQRREYQETEEEKRKLLLKVVEPQEPPINAQTTSEQLYQELQNKRSSVQLRKSELERYELALKSLSDRTTQIPTERAAANERLKQVEMAISQYESGKHDKPELSIDDSDNQIRLLVQYARKRATELELRMLDVEAQRQELARKVIPMSRDLVSREITRLETESKSWDEAAARIRKAEVTREVAQARQAAINAHPALRTMAQRNQELVSQRTQINERLQQLTIELDKTRSESEAIELKRKAVENKIQAAGLTNENGMLLVDLRRNLLPPGESYVRVRQIQSEMQVVNLSVVQLTEERDALAEPLQVVQQQIGESQSDNELVEMALEFVAAKRDYVDQLLSDFQKYRGLLTDVKVEREKLIDRLNETTAYIDENALWIRSASPIAINDLWQARSGVKSFFDREKWRELAGSTCDRMSGKPYETAIAGIGLIALFIFNRRLKGNRDSREER